MGRFSRGILVTLKVMLGVVLVLILAVLSLVGYATSEQDCDRYRAFSQAVDRWQVRPEFRAVGREYCQLSSAALRTRPLGIRGPTLIMFLRSLPYLPEHLAVSSTSGEHYARFAQGSLSAYMHLSGEQGVEWAGGLFVQRAGQPSLTDEQAKEFLGSFKPPVSLDDGAVASLRGVLRDIGGEPLEFRGKVNAKVLAPYVASVARRLEYIGPAVLTSVEQEQVAGQLSTDQQEEVLRQLDAEVHGLNPELWRAKQISDFLGGVWAQGYGPTYNSLIVGVLKLHSFARWAVPIMLAAMVAGVWVRRRQRARLTRAAVEGDTGKRR